MRMAPAPEHPHSVLRALASTQDGQFAVAQALTSGVNRAALRWLASRGEIVRLRNGVWRFAAAAGKADPAVTAMLRCHPEAVICRKSAAQRHRLRRVALPPEPEIAVAHDRRIAPAGIAVHRTRALPRGDILVEGGIRYTTVTRTIIDLQDPDDPWESLAILDDGVAAGGKPRKIHDRATDLLLGRPELSLICRATQPGASHEFRSWLERSSAHIYEVSGIPQPEWNVAVHDDQGQIGIVDAMWRRWDVIAEKEGLRFHTTPRQRRNDAERFNRLGDVVNAVKRFTWQDVATRPLYVAQTMHRALRAEGADLDPARIPRAIDIPDRPFVS